MVKNNANNKGGRIVRDNMYECVNRGTRVVMVVSIKGGREEVNINGGMGKQS
jgi:hypothetical protein